ncbi:hypothetical protein [Candidatus Ponderosibacter sp. Uisw_141_02]|uniref:hypothetical protein n=1 Tax=Candidatus Ponderosibacter sp. Uisw_141_02 TaxID=3231000 RepID=UPI003D595902
MCFNRLKFHNANRQACCFTVPKRTVIKASYGYDLQARKNFSDAPKMGHANLTENTNSHLDRGMNKAGLAVMLRIGVKSAPSPDKANIKGGKDDVMSSRRHRSR